MMHWIVGASLKFRLLVLPVAAIMMFAGIVQLRRAPVDVLPEFTPPSVQIQTEALGLSAEEVEQFITVPMEQDLLNGVPWLDTIRSQSVAGLSTVDLIFQPGTDLLRARQVVQERMTQAVALPHVSKPPVMIEPESSTSRIMVIGLSAKNISLIDMSVLAQWRVRPRLMGVQGVANVSLWGQRDRQLQVQVDPQRLAAAGITLNQIIQTTGNALWVSPLTFVEASTPGTGGFLETPNQRLTIQHVLPITTPEGLAQVPVEDSHGPVPTRLGDVATVVEDHQQPLIGDAVVDGSPGIMLVVDKAPGANTRDVTEGVESALRALSPGLAGVQIDTAVYRPASYIDSAIGNVGRALLIAVILMIVLFGFVFFDWRTAVVSTIAIILSALTALLVLFARGTGLNMLVLSGLVIALGVLVDDAVVNVDTVRRHLAEQRASGVDTPRSAAIVAAVREVRWPILYATLVILVAAIPLMAMGGLNGAFTRPLALSYLLAVAASTLVALTVTPALALTLFAGSGGRRDAATTQALRRRYAGVLSRTVHWGRAAAIVAAVVVAGAGLLLPHLHGTLLPAPQERDLLISWTGTPSMSAGETVRITQAASAELRTLPGVSNVGVHVGRAINSDEQLGVNSGELWVSIRPNADYATTVASIQRVVAGYPGFDHRVFTYPEQQVGQVQTGTRGDVTVRVFGLDMDMLRTKADEVRRLMAGVPGVVSPQVDLPAQQPTIEIEVDLAAAQRFGIKPGDVRRATATLLSGLIAGSLYEDQKVFDVLVLGVPSTRDSLSAIQNVLIDTPSGGHVRVKDVAQVRVRPDPVIIRHDNVSRRVDVTANVRGRDLRSVVADIRTRLGGVSFPVEYHAEVLQQYAQESANRTGAWALTGVVLAVILLLLQAAFRSWRLAALVLVALFAAPAGGVLAASATGNGFSLGSLVGLFAVWVLAVRQVVVLIWRYGRDPGERGVEDVVSHTAERFVPVLKTALATGLAVLPMAVLGNVAGLEMLRPLAIVVLGGLVTSTLVSLFVVPAVFVAYSGRMARQPRQPVPVAVPSLEEVGS
jgi:CzcA family heavy metal efflux pump